MHVLPVSLVFLAAGYQRGIEVDSKPATASLSLPNARLSDTSVDRVTIDSPRDGQREGSQEALHSPTTGQLKTVSVNRWGMGGVEQGRGGEGRGGVGQERADVVLYVKWELIHLWPPLGMVQCLHACTSMYEVVQSRGCMKRLNDTTYVCIDSQTHQQSS